MNLITGGAGFIGSHLVEALLDEGEEVRVLERPGVGVDHLPLAAIDLVSADICDRAAMARATRNCSHVYHLAADPPLAARPARVRRHRQFGGLRALDGEHRGGADDGVPAHRLAAPQRPRHRRPDAGGRPRRGRRLPGLGIDLNETLLARYRA